MLLLLPVLLFLSAPPPMPMGFGVTSAEAVEMMCYNLPILLVSAKLIHFIVKAKLSAESTFLAELILCVFHSQF
jgi:hypothetical protein